MMLRQLLLPQLPVYTFAVLFCSCVSVGIDKPKVQHSSSVEFMAPSSPFEKFEAKNLDSAWKNSKNGNSISYLSDCNTENDPSHEAILDGIVASVPHKKVLSSEMIQFNNRKALQAKVSGSVDGVETLFEVLVLKKNNCIYVLTYVGLNDSFKRDLSTFEKFKEGFKVP